MCEHARHERRVAVAWLCPALVGFLLFSLPGAGASLLDCEWYNESVAKCWNQGTIENTTFFRDDGLQMANALDRFSWATYGAGLAYVTDGGEWVMRGTEAIPNWNLSYEVVPDEYYAAAWNRELCQAGKCINFTYGLGQKVYDDYVNFTITGEFNDGWDGWDRPLYLYRSMRGIDVGNDDHYDIIDFEADGVSYGLMLNQSEDLLFTNVTGNSILIGTLNISLGVRWWWEGDAQYVLFLDAYNTSVNADVYWGRKYDIPPSGFTNKSGRLTHYWIDAEECIRTYPPWCNNFPLFLYCTPTGSTTTCVANSTHEAKLRGREYCTGFLGTAPVDQGNGCYLVQLDNTSGVVAETPYKTSDDRELVCESYSSASCKQDKFDGGGGGFTRNWTVQCRQEGNFTILGQHDETLGYTNAMLLQCGTDSADPGVTLQQPPDDSEHDLGDAITFTGNASDSWPLSNVTLIFYDGLTPVANETASVFPNLTTNKSFTPSDLPLGTTTWTVQACDNNGNCALASPAWDVIVNAVLEAVSKNYKPYRLFGNALMYGWWF